MAEDGVEEYIEGGFVSAGLGLPGADIMKEEEASSSGPQSPLGGPGSSMPYIPMLGKVSRGRGGKQITYPWHWLMISSTLAEKST